MESTSGMREGCGLQYRPTSENAVTRRKPPDAFGTRNDGLTYSTVMPRSSGFLNTPMVSSSSNLDCSSFKRSFEYCGRRPLRCGGAVGPMFTTASNGPTAPLYPTGFALKTDAYSVCRSWNFETNLGSSILSGSMAIESSNMRLGSSGCVCWQTSG